MGAGVFGSSQYAALAGRMAADLGGGSDLARAILAQMACEKADGWPPQDNNPLNVHVAALASIGISAQAGVGDGGACAAFASPEAGADAAVALLQGASRYKAAVAAARANSGAGYLAAVTAAGWGTSYSCAAGYYGGQGTPASSSPAGLDLNPADWIANLNAGVQTMQSKLGVTAAPGLSAVPEPNTIASGAATVATAAANAASTALGGVAAASGIPQAIASLPAALGGALGALAVNLAVLFVVLLLAYKGLEMIVEPEGGSLAETAAMGAV